MAMGRRAKNRLKMFGLVFCCSSVIAALATSTMAWYAAESSITVDPSSSSVTIRTPFQYHFYSYKGNRASWNGSSWVWTEATASTYAKGSGYNPLYNPNGANSDVTHHFELNDDEDYQEVNELLYYDSDHKGDYLAALENASGLWPGYRMSFAIYAEGFDGTTDAPILKVKSIVNENTSAAKRYVYGTTSTPIYIQEAITIRAGSGATLDAAYRACAEKTKPTEWATGRTAEMTLATTAGNPTSYWYYFEIEFSNAQSTYYLPCTNEGATRTTPDVAETANYYKPQHDETGNSSVYEGLKFSFATMTLENTSA